MNYVYEWSGFLSKNGLNLGCGNPVFETMELNKKKTYLALFNINVLLIYSKDLLINQCVNYGKLHPEEDLLIYNKSQSEQKKTSQS